MRPLLIAAAAVLAFAPAAQAKGPVQVCGVGSCATLAGEGDGMQWLFSFEPPPGTTPPSLPAPSPYYLVRFAGIGGTLAYWIPAHSTLRYVGSGVPGWTGRLDAASASLLAAKAAGLTPFAPPAHVQAYVDVRPVTGDLTYLRLFTLGTRVTSPPVTSWLPVWIMGAPSPWTDGGLDLRIARRGNYLWRDGAVFAIPRAVAERVRSLKPLR